MPFDVMNYVAGPLASFLGDCASALDSVLYHPLKARRGVLVRPVIDEPALFIMALNTPEGFIRLRADAGKVSVIFYRGINMERPEVLKPTVTELPQQELVARIDDQKVKVYFKSRDGDLIGYDDPMYQVARWNSLAWRAMGMEEDGGGPNFIDSLYGDD